MKFEELNIIEPILKALKDENYKEPSKIQEEAIPSILLGKDLLGCAQTGTGKTAAFAIPTLQLLHNSNKIAKKKKIQSLILTPTRELAIQIYDNFQSYGKNLNLKSAVIFGGVSQKPQEEVLRKGVDILIATPGRLNDLVNQKIIDLSEIEIFILDEADRMLDMGFINDVKKIIRYIPKKRQTLFFSATMPSEIKKLVSTLLVDPVVVEVTPVSSTVDKIKQSLYYVDKANKRKLLISLLKTDEIKSALVFTRTKSDANRLVKYLEDAQIGAKAIHGNKSQNARQEALQSFKDKKIQVLIATDIAARGIDIDELSHVINYGLPNIPETYVHRIGRTGRAGQRGIAISFSDVDEVPFVRDIEKLIKKKIDVVEGHKFPMVNLTPSPKTKATGNRPRTGHNTRVKGTGTQSTSKNTTAGNTNANKTAATGSENTRKAVATGNTNKAKTTTSGNKNTFKSTATGNQNTFRTGATANPNTRTAGAKKNTTRRTSFK
ncbi:ATP-dependent RNA helicase RhlE [Clostridium gelidum]|uniref:ATP-dependent RNA helicase RhlE n=1 Tax=Clostridium gelidum TaxID=704125 RepID=A0ABN6IZW7_9CLOT|nr:DEAD/DEAH box helicase [Clostridium gelidum]BCZ47655.1 ATP-dependent RNA helicase RhlE [Clostridium gelidum]